MRIDAVIPVYKPDRRLLEILKRLSRQTWKLTGIHLVNTEKVYLDRMLQANGLTEQALLEKYPGLDITHIRKAEFDHGATRNLGARRCGDADYVIMMTQDALPAGKDLAEKLVEPLVQDAALAVSYARQLPNRGASAAERCSRAFNYPDTPLVKSEKDFEKLGIKTYFCSNVCAAYRMETFRTLGGFSCPMIFNEDMVYAGRALKAGYSIRYSADARVYHSHNYGPMQQFHRNFDLGVSQAQHPEIFGGAQSEGEGVRYVKTVLSCLRARGKWTEMPEFLTCCAFRYLGFSLGKHYEKLPKRLILSFTSNREFWSWKAAEGRKAAGAE